MSVIPVCNICDGPNVTEQRGDGHYASYCTVYQCYFCELNQGTWLYRIGNHQWRWNEREDSAGAVMVREHEMRTARRDLRQMFQMIMSQPVEPPPAPWQHLGF